MTVIYFAPTQQEDCYDKSKNIHELLDAFHATHFCTTKKRNMQAPTLDRRGYTNLVFPWSTKAKVATEEMASFAAGDSLL